MALGTFGSHVAAYFDVDGTLTATNSVTPLLWFRKRRGLFQDRAWMASLPLRVPWWMLRYRLDNAAGNRTIYRNYAGFDAAWIRGESSACFEECLKPRLITAIVERLHEFKRSGIRVVLITGGLDFVMQPVAQFLGVELIAPGLLEYDGVFTGEMNRAPLTGSGKYVAVCRHATQHGIDLNASHAFGNEYADANMLHAVGHPVVVCPDKRLRAIAGTNGWEIVE